MSDIDLTSLIRLVVPVLLSILAGGCPTGCVAVPTTAKQDSPNVHVQTQQQTGTGSQNQTVPPAEPETRPSGSTWNLIASDPLL
ncbi:MAG: hypothetical protein WAO15_23840, partial [Mycobacterium sp.]